MRHLRVYEDYIKPNLEAFNSLYEDIQKEIEKIFSKINDIIKQGHYLKNGDRVFHKKDSGDIHNGYYGTFIRTGSGFHDWHIEWDDPECKKGSHPDVKYDADWRGGFNFMKADLKPEYDKLLIELKKFQTTKENILPTSVRCIESTSEYFKPDRHYRVSSNYDGYFVRIETHGGLTNYYWERIRATEDGYTWVWEYPRKDINDSYAVFENDTVKDFVISFNKRNIQKRFDL